MGAKMIQLRPYQAEAVRSVYQYLENHDDNPCVVTPTASGKSIMIAQIATDAVCRWRGRVLVLAHVKELLEQNAGKIKALCDGIEVGVYSAGLNSRDTDTPILVAGIQSIYNKADIIGKFDLIIIDEAHCIAPDGEGMYRTFLLAMQKKNPLLRVIGFTATPYRMKGGLICKPENILNKICYEVGIKEMIAHGYLSPLISYAGKAEADLSSLHIRGGEFIADEVEKAMDEERLVVSACREIYEKTMDRKSVLIFTSSVKHCRHVVKILSEMAHQEVAIVTGDTPPDERAEILDRFKGVEIKDLLGDAKPPLKFLCNVNVLTTGFDAPNVDCIALLRPTNSPGLLVQMIGRGFRLSPETGKKNCLILDYGENIMRHGPIDCIRIHEREKGNGKAPAKMCPECRALIHASYSICPECGFQFPINNRNIKISPYASRDGVLSGQISYEEYDVLDVSYEIHHKRGDSSAPPTLQVNYRVGLYQFKHEWVCPEHSGYARQKFEKWWYMRAAVGVLAPATVEEALSMARDGLLAEPKKIRVQIVSGEKYERIVKVELGERPRFTPVEADEEIPF